jgi:restriction endonuclease S subunit
MYCNEAIMFFKHDSELINKYLYNYFAYYDFYAKNETNGQIGNGSLNKQSLYNLNIIIPSKEKQQEIVNLIDKLNKEDHHFQTYENSINTQIDYIYETIENMCSANNEKEYMNEIEENIEDKEDNTETEEKEITKDIEKIIKNKTKIKSDQLLDFNNEDKEFLNTKESDSEQSEEEVKKPAPKKKPAKSASKSN